MALAPFDETGAFELDVADPQPRAPLQRCQRSAFRATETGELVGSPLGHSGSVFAVAISPDGKEVLTGGRDQQARIWNLQTRHPTERVLAHLGAVQDVAYSPDGTRILTGTATGEVYMWSAATGERVGPPVVSRDDEITHVFFGAGGKHAFVSGHFGAELWEIGESQGVALDEPGLWVRAKTGKEMTASGTLKWLDRATWLECQRRVNKQRKQLRTQ